MDLPTPEQISQLVELVEDAKMINWIAVGAVTLLIYDHALTFRDEVHFMWRSRWGLAKILFIWSRYFALIATCGMVFLVTLQNTRSDIGCQVFLQVETGVSTLIIGTVDLVLMLRVWILYGGKKPLLAVLLMFLAGEVSCMVLVQIFAVSHFKSFLRLGPFLHGCYSEQNPPKILPLMLVPPLIVSVVMCCMTLYKCKDKIIPLFGFPSRQQNTQPVLELFLRDGTFWFIAVFAVDFCQLMMWLYARPSIFSILIIPSIVIYTILATRALLNIKNVVARDRDHDSELPPDYQTRGGWSFNGPKHGGGSQSAPGGDNHLTPMPSKSSRRTRTRSNSSSGAKTTPSSSTSCNLLPVKFGAPPPQSRLEPTYRRDRAQSHTSSIEPLRPNGVPSKAYTDSVMSGDADWQCIYATSPTSPSADVSRSNSHSSAYAHNSRLDTLLSMTPELATLSNPTFNYSRPFSAQQPSSPTKERSVPGYNNSFGALRGYR